MTSYPLVYSTNYLMMIDLLCGKYQGTQPTWAEIWVTAQSNIQLVLDMQYMNMIQPAGRRYGLQHSQTYSWS